MTLALGASPGSATLGGTLTVQAVNGKASFSSLTISKIGSGYALQASSPGLTSATTAAFNATDQLVVTTQPPTSIAAGSPFGLVVAAEDGRGNIDTSFGGSVTVVDTSGVSLGGASAVNGVANFSGLTESQVGGQYLYVSSSGLASATTAVFTVRAGPPVKLEAWTPSGVLANGPFTLTVDTEDQYGNTNTTFGGNVTVALAANPNNATLSGTLTAQASGGFVSFAGLAISKVGSGYILQVSSAGLTSGATAAFSVTEKLVVTTQPPASVTAGSPFGMSVALEDGQGNVDTSFSGSVTVSDVLDRRLGGTLTVDAVNGVAAFSGLTENIADSLYLSAATSGLTTVYATL